MTADGTMLRGQLSTAWGLHKESQAIHDQLSAGYSAYLDKLVNPKYNDIAAEQKPGSKAKKAKTEDDDGAAATKRKFTSKRAETEASSAASEPANKPKKTADS